MSIYNWRGFSTLQGENLTRTLRIGIRMLCLLCAHVKFWIPLRVSNKMAIGKGLLHLRMLMITPLGLSRAWQK